ASVQSFESSRPFHVTAACLDPFPRVPSLWSDRTKFLAQRVSPSPGSAAVKTSRLPARRQPARGKTTDPPPVAGLTEASDNAVAVDQDFGRCSPTLRPTVAASGAGHAAAEASSRRFLR